MCGRQALAIGHLESQSWMLQVFAKREGIWVVDNTTNPFKAPRAAMCDVRASSVEQNPPDAVQVLKQVVAYRDRSLGRHFRCDGVANDMTETRKLNLRLRSANAAFTLESFGLGWTQALHCPARWFCTRSMSIIATAASSWLCWREVCGLNIYTSRRLHDKSITSFLSLASCSW